MEIPWRQHGDSPRNTLSGELAQAKCYLLPVRTLTSRNGDKCRLSAL